MARPLDATPSSAVRPLRILYLEDNEADAELALQALRGGGFAPQVRLVRTREDFETRLSGDNYDLVLSAFNVPGWSGMEALALVRERAGDLPFVFVTGTRGDEPAAAAIKRGATDYVLKDRVDRLPQAVTSALAERRMREERRDARHALAESEMRYRALTEASFDGIVLTDKGGGAILEANRGFAEMVGVVADQLPGVRFHEFVAPESRSEVEAKMTAGVVERFTFTGRTRDGRRLELEALTRPSTAQGRPVQLTALRDHTEHRELERQFLHAQRLEAVARLAGGIAHDFNNILTGILGFSEFIMDQLPPEHPLRSDAEEIHRAGQLAAGLTRKLLIFSRRQVAKPEVFDLNRAVTETAGMLSRLLGADIELNINAKGNPSHIFADPGQIEQVIMNLAVNARDAMPAGGPLRIVTGAVDLHKGRLHSGGLVPPGHYVVLTVTDQGVGMTPEVLTRIYEPFFTTKEVGKGTGLGLATVYGIVRGAGGHITVQSAPGRGTTFELFFPATRPEADPRSVTRPLGAAWGDETVLVVEDQPAIRLLTQRILARAGYVVLLAESGEEARELATRTQTRIHLILMDVLLPGERGPRVAADLVRAHPEARLIFMSGNVDAGDESEFPGGRPAFLQKPFTPEQLLSAIRLALDAPTRS